jgi:hypothetical protein
MRIGEANRPRIDILTALTVKKAVDRKFAVAKACWVILCSQILVSDALQAKLVVHAFAGQAAAVFQQWLRLTPLRLRMSCGRRWNGGCTMPHRFRVSVASFKKRV